MGTNNKPCLFSLSETLLDEMEEKKPIKSTKDYTECPLGLNEDFRFLPAIVREIKDTQELNFEEIKKVLSSLNETIVDTDKGIYHRVKYLESFKSSFSKWYWILITSLTGIVVAGVLKLVIFK